MAISVVECIYASLAQVVTPDCVHTRGNNGWRGDNVLLRWAAQYVYY